MENRYIIFTLLLIFLIGTVSFVCRKSGYIKFAELDSDINSIKIEITDIQENVALYKKIKKDQDDASSEGGFIEYYFDNNQLKKVLEIHFGETGKFITEYYYTKGELIFVYTKEYQYNRPIYWDKQAAKEMGDNEVFDLKKSKIKKNEYYFKNETLIGWVNYKGKAEAVGSKEFKKKEIDLLENGQRFLD
jgi:hypothetical protein